MTSNVARYQPATVRAAFGRIGRLMLPAALLLLIVFAAVPPLTAQASSSCFVYSVGRLSLKFSHGSYKNGSFTGYRNNDCTDPYDYSFETDGGGWVRASGYSEAKEICDRKKGADTNPRRSNNSGMSFWRCGSGSATTSTSSSSSGGSSNRGGAGSSGGGSGQTSNRSPAPAPVYTGPSTGEIIQQFGIKVSATLGLDSGIQFQRRGPAAVGIPSVIEIGVLDVVDVWGYVVSSYEVCFPQVGAIIFLDATTSPRTADAIPYYMRDGYTCAKRDSAGMLVLVQADASASSGDSTAISTLPTKDAGPVSPLTHCQITTLYRLNLRNAPDGDAILMIVPHQVELDATARTARWFKVSYKDTEGWLAAWYVSTWGRCRVTKIA